MWSTVEAFRANFPEEAGQVLEPFILNTIRRSHALKGAIDYRPGEAYRLVSQFLSSQSANISRSDDKRLTAVFAAQKSYYEWLRRIPDMCALLAEGNKEALRLLADPELKHAAPPAMISRITRGFKALLDAAGNGRKQPQIRDFTRFPPRLLSTLAALPSKHRQFILGKSTGTSSDKCEAQIAVNEAVSRLPQSEVSFWMGFLYDTQNPAQSVPVPSI